MERVACFVSERSPPNFAPEYMPGPLCCRPVPWRVSVYANPGGGRNSVPRQSAKYSSQCPPFPPPPREESKRSIIECAHLRVETGNHFHNLLRQLPTPPSKGMGSSACVRKSTNAGEMLISSGSF